MKRLKRILVLLSLPLLLIAFGVIGILRQPSLQSAITILSGEIEGAYTQVNHTIYTPVIFENFFFLLIRNGSINHLGTADLNYKFSDQIRFRFRSDDNVDGKFRLKYRQPKIEIRYDFDADQISSLDSIQDVLKYVMSLRPSVHYSRKKSQGTFQVKPDDNGQSQIGEINDTDEIMLSAFPLKSKSGEVTINHGPIVSYNVDPTLMGRDPSYSLIMSVPELLITDSIGSVSIGKSKWDFSHGDRLKVWFKPETSERSKLKLESEEGQVLKLPTHLLMLRCDDDNCRIEVGGEIKGITLNGEELRDTLLGLSFNWFIAALAGGLLGGIVSLYFDFLHRKA